MSLYIGFVDQSNIVNTIGTNAAKADFETEVADDSLVRSPDLGDLKLISCMNGSFGETERKTQTLLEGRLWAVSTKMKFSNFGNKG